LTGLMLAPVVGWLVGLVPGRITIGTGKRVPLTNAITVWPPGGKPEAISPLVPEKRIRQRRARNGHSASREPGAVRARTR
jgi:hypothetical protein